VPKSISISMKGPFAVCVRRVVGRLERSRERPLVAHVNNHHRRTERVRPADPYPDAGHPTGRASRFLVIGEAGKEILVPFPEDRMKASPVSTCVTTLKSVPCRDRKIHSYFDASFADQRLFAPLATPETTGCALYQARVRPNLKAL
jgi:hypothetical protein